MRLSVRRSLYIHVPFCAQKCHYCAFFSQAPRGELVDRYVGSLILEMERLGGGGAPATVFFGGGTPSLLSLGQWRRLCGAMDRLGLLGAAEWTVECNPATVSADKARLLREHGVNRISMGVQSLDEGLLDRLGRVHTRDMVFRSFDTLRAAGFDNVNLDLMFAIPGQTLEVWERTLSEVLAMGSEHLSCYEVIYEDDTPLYQQLAAGEVEVDEDLACAMYEQLIERAAAAGFMQYEIANFATGGGTGLVAGLPAQVCRHNVNYWRGGDYDGLGPSATAYVAGVRARNWANTPMYCDLIESGRSAVEWSERLEPLGRAGELAAFGLRMNAGWSFEEFRRRSGYDLRAEWADEMRRLVETGSGVADEAGFRLTPRGLRFADAAAAEFLRSGRAAA